MPIYEFYCPDCHMLFSFRARRIDTTSRPACPRCHKPELDRRVSRVAVSRGRSGGEEASGEHEGGADPFAGMDPSRMERAIETLARESDGIDENDPRQAGHLMRRFLDATGLERGPAMEEAIRRLEAGGDSDAIDQELGDALEQETGKLFPGGPAAGVSRFRRSLPPRIDDTLYEL